MLKDRLSLGFGAGALALMIFAILTISLQNNLKLESYPEDSPAGVVQRYLQALEDSRLETARTYLGNETLDAIKPNMAAWTGSDASHRIILVSETIESETAVVVVDILTSYQTSGIESSSYTNRVIFELRLQEDNWKIYSPSQSPF